MKWTQVKAAALPLSKYLSKNAIYRSRKCKKCRLLWLCRTVTPDAGYFWRVFSKDDLRTPQNLCGRKTFIQWTWRQFLMIWLQVAFLFMRVFQLKISWCLIEINDDFCLYQLLKPQLNRGRRWTLSGADRGVSSPLSCPVPVTVSPVELARLMARSVVELSDCVECESVSTHLSKCCHILM